ncbi:MAG TPA: pyruvate formate lyase family protein [Sumerlaeia bacterium]|nr:pyruvate formate lyase family protein [Sumerlaeia bacterium]
MGEGSSALARRGDAQDGWTSSWRPAVPKQLSDLTRRLAERALAGEHGRSMANADFELDEREVADLSPNMRYARAAQLVAENAPLRILPGERIVGSATLLEAPQHQTPVAAVGGTSHTTIGFHRVLKTGYAGLRKQIAERFARGGSETHSRGRLCHNTGGSETHSRGRLCHNTGGSETHSRGRVRHNAAASSEGQEDLLRAMEMCLDAAATWHRRHLDLLAELAEGSVGEERATYLCVRQALERVPENPPETFHEAVQSLWFMYAFQRLMGNWSGIGRIDEMLGPYLRRDLEAERLTLDEAREILAQFWIKGCEWIGAPCVGESGDAQFYQNIILSGVDADGADVTNEATYLILDIVEELHISDFPIAVRIHSETPDRLLRRVAEVQRRGGGIVALYNEEVVIDGLVQFGYPLEEARTFTNDGCWEVLIPGKTNFAYAPFDMLALLQGTLGLHDGSQPAPDYADFEDLYRAFIETAAKRVDQHHAEADGFARGGPPAPLLSLFVEDCIGKGRGYHDRGARYNVLAPHAGGMANAADSLLVIKKLIYDEKFLSLPEFIEILRSDWDGQEPLRRLILDRFEFYGNDDDEADGMMERLFNDYTDLVGRVREREGVLRPAGISTFGREIGWRTSRKASPDGHRMGEILATNFSPSPGADRHGPTAAVKSYCKMDFTRAPNGATIELKIDPASVKGDAGRDALVALMRSFVQLGGFYMHVDVVDSATLQDAQRHPEKYPNLPVRISGWSARFATLSKEWQDMVIARTQHIC